jgi:D,D-heptose 1,7-bisphosphate phosphatase
MTSQRTENAGGAKDARGKAPDPEPTDRRAVFIDRDGTLNEEVGYLDRLDRLRILPGVVEAVRALRAGGFKIVVITNQSGIARGFFTEGFIQALHAEIQGQLSRQGAPLDGFYVCPHHPTEGKEPYRRVCACRKPEPGLLLRAAEEMGIALRRSFMVGDMLKDVETAERAGAGGILVKTGYGQAMLAELPRSAIRPLYVAEDLRDAARWILRREQP